MLEIERSGGGINNRKKIFNVSAGVLIIDCTVHLYLGFIGYLILFLITKFPLISLSFSTLYRVQSSQVKWLAAGIQTVDFCTLLNLDNRNTIGTGISILIPLSTVAQIFFLQKRLGVWTWKIFLLNSNRPFRFF